MLVRAIAVLLCLLPTAWAQGVQEDIAEALDLRTEQGRRLELLDRIDKTEGGLGQLVQKLDGRLDTEVVSAVVGHLFKKDKYLPYLPRICGLLEFKAHREKVLTRIQSVGEHPEDGRKLRDELLKIAKGDDARDDPELRGAAIDALGRVPLRSVLKEIVALGLTDPKVRAAALRHVKQLGFPTLKSAQQHLQKNPNDSVYDILRKNLAAKIKELERFRALQLAQLKTASARDALAAMEDSDVETRLAASTRLKELAEKKEYGELGAKEFAGQVFDLFVAERLNPNLDGKTLTHLCAALDVLARGDEKEKSPLWQAKERAAVVEALQPLAAGDSRLSSDELLAVGSAAVSLLHTAGEAARAALAAFARRFPDAAARKGAIQSLGDFARRFEASRDYVGRTLAGMLPTEKVPAVRRQILATLNQRFVPAAEALEPIRGYLQPQTAKQAPKLDDTEIRDCIGILGRIGSDPALALLRKVARGHPELRVRRFAVEDGLLPWAARNGKEDVILKDLLDLVIGKGQPLKARRAVIDALGAKGTRNAHATLNVIVQTQGIDPGLQVAAVAAKLSLAERLAAPPDGRATTADDLRTAVKILEEERGAADLARLDKLARAIVEAGDSAKLAVRTARYRLVTLYLRRPEKERDQKELRQRYADAANQAQADALPASAEQALLLEYKELLLADDTDDSRRKAMDYVARAAELEKTGDKKKAATLYMDAAEIAIQLKLKPMAQSLLNQAMGTGGVGGELTARMKQLRDASDALPGQQ
ncbi:MAG: HEAT repeat domain-containing protein [Planctomycetota bacterium]